jgi:hypothetical protein
MAKITFTTKFDIEPEYYPKPASAIIPDWLVKMQAYGGFHEVPEGTKTVLNRAEPNSTIKRCVPVLDAATAGYIIFTNADIWVQRDPNLSDPIIQTRGPLGVSSHEYGQAKLHPAARKNMSFPKLSNPWMIKTPKGYSTLFVAPMHNPNGIFTALPAIVDTDQYTQEVNFPFTLDDPDFVGLIPAGTPIIQAIPFKRESWQMEIGGHEEISEAAAVGRRHATKIFNVYRSLFWSRKEFK